MVTYVNGSSHGNICLWDRVLMGILQWLFQIEITLIVTVTMETKKTVAMETLQKTFAMIIFCNTYNGNIKKQKYYKDSYHGNITKTLPCKFCSCLHIYSK